MSIAYRSEPRERITPHPRPYRHLSLSEIFGLIDQAMSDMDAAGRAGDKGAYIKAADALEHLHDEWDRRDDRKGRR